MNSDEVAVINLKVERFYLHSDCPFKKADELIEEAQETNADYFC